MLGSEGGPLNWSAALGYDYSATDWLDLSAAGSHTKYLTDSINAITDLENSLSLDLVADLSVVDVDIGYEMYLGSTPAKYLTADISHLFRFGALSIEASAMLTYLSLKIDAEKLDAFAVRLKKKKTVTTSIPAKTTVNLTGISSYSLDLTIRYDLGRGFRVYLNPSYLVTPKGELAAQSAQLSWIMGLRYSTKF